MDGGELSTLEIATLYDRAARATIAPEECSTNPSLLQGSTRQPSALRHRYDSSGVSVAQSSRSSPPESAVNRPSSLQDGIHGSNPENHFARDGENGLELNDVEADATSSIRPKKKLGYVQTTSLIINLIFGSGVFTTPGLVVALTCSKEMALILFGVGGLCTAVTAVIYFEYARALPFNGGPLIYLDVLFPRPKLFATVLFSFHRILIESTASNCRILAITLLRLAYPSVPSSNLSSAAIKSTAVAVQGVVCLLLYFARPLCFVFNSWFAVYKLVVVFVMFAAAMSYVKSSGSEFGDVTTKHEGYSAVHVLTAFVFITFSYSGISNVNSIGGEIATPGKTFKWAAVTAIILITLLYMMVVFALFTVLDYAELTAHGNVDNVSLLFARKTFLGEKAMNIFQGISTFSNLIFEVYTTARVKQAIAWQGIIPFSGFFGREDKQFDSPGGALVLHLIFTVIPLLALDPTTDVRNFAMGVYSYGYQIVLLLLGIGLLVPQLRKRIRNTDVFEFEILGNKYALITITFLFVGFSILICFTEAFYTAPGNIPRWLWPVTVFAVLVLASVYWGVIRIFALKPRKGCRHIRKWIGLQINIWHATDKNIPPHMTEAMKIADDDGSKRRLEVEVSGFCGVIRDTYRRLVDWIFDVFGYSWEKESAERND